MFDLYKEAVICSELDWEITVAGNGHNAYTVASILRHCLKLLGLTSPEPTEAEIREYIQSVGEDPDEYL